MQVFSLFKVFNKQPPKSMLSSSLPIKIKIFKLACLVSALTSGMGFIINIFMKFPLALNLLIAICFGLSIYLFFKAPDEQKLESDSLTLIFMDLLIIGLTWFFNGGLHSSTPYFILLLISVSALLLSKKWLYFTLAASSIMLIGLTYLEKQYPQWLIHYDYAMQASLDILSSVIVLSFLLAWSIHQMTREYVSQFQRAEEASKSKSLFLSQLSHEFRTPLNAVIGFSGQMIHKMDMLPADKQKLFAQKINTNGAHLLALVNQILDLSLIETGKIELFFQEVNLSQLLQEVKELVDVLANEKDLFFNLELPASQLIVKTDPNRLRQVLLNLLGNAIKFTEQGGVICRILEVEDGFLIEIEDTGSGISVEQQQIIFEPLTRLSEHAHHEGTGLGLAITRSLCQHLGYQLTIRNAPQTGSVFSVKIPHTFNPVF